MITEEESRRIEVHRGKRTKRNNPPRRGISILSIKRRERKQQSTGHAMFSSTFDVTITVQLDGQMQQLIIIIATNYYNRNGNNCVDVILVTALM